MRGPLIPFPENETRKRHDYFRRFVPETVSESHTAFANEIVRCIVGSELHGTGLAGTEDHDEMGVYIEPPELVLGFRQMEHYQWRSKPEGVKSEHGDTDLIMYSLRKYMSMAMQGNPSILLLLFCPEEFILYNTNIGRELREITPHIISKRAAPRFVGYLNSQKSRLTGEKKGHTPNRPELIEQFGYDTKYAMHALRLGYQGIELMQTGTITLPINGSTGEYLRSVRRGEVSYQAVLDDLDYVESALIKVTNKSPLQDEPNKDFIEKWLLNTHREHWEWN